MSAFSVLNCVRRPIGMRPAPGSFKYCVILQFSLPANLCSRLFKAGVELAPDASVGANEPTPAAQLPYAEQAGSSELLNILRDMGVLVGNPPRSKPRPTFGDQILLLGTRTDRCVDVGGHGARAQGPDFRSTRSHARPKRRCARNVPR